MYAGVRNLRWNFVLVYGAIFTNLARSNDVDFPSIIDSEDISYFFHEYNTTGIDDLHWALTSIFSQRVRSKGGTVPLPERLVSIGSGDFYTTKYKLQCDLEHANYLVNNRILMENGRTNVAFVKEDATFGIKAKDTATDLHEYFAKTVIPNLETMISRIPPLEELSSTNGLYPFKSEDLVAAPDLVNFYNKALYVPEYEIPSRILNPAINAKEIEQEWADSGNILSVIDNVLSDETLTAVRNLLLESTVWYQTKAPKTLGGYVGAYIDDGLHSRLLLEVAKELHLKFPLIFKGHDLKYLWSYKYDARYGGIHTHADQAAVNVNLWLTPDEANLHPNSGGLVIFTSKPPGDWEFTEYNSNPEIIHSKILAPHFTNITVPYKYNRAVIFDSALFHHTDSFTFKKGYENRRINLTLLYGEMQHGSKGTCDPGDGCASQ